VRRQEHRSQAVIGVRRNHFNGVLSRESRRSRLSGAGRKPCSAWSIDLN
jgi:hypothetical protein